MKRISLLGLSSALLLLVTSSCQKKELITQSPSESKEIHPIKSKNNLRVWYENPEDENEFGCWMSGGSCLDDVIVTPWLADNLTDFANSSDQKAFVSANYSSLSEVIDKNLLDQVITRDVKVSLRGKITTTQIGYLIFKSASGDNIQSVNPFKQ